MSGGPQDDRYDVMISYARENGPSVQDRLYKPLSRCHNRQGRRARVFLDEGSPASMRPGRAVHEVLAAAIRHSNAVVLVYSRAYFESNMCRWEWNLALMAATDRSSQVELAPVLLERVPEEVIPLALRQYQYQATDQEGWFAALCQTLDLVCETAALELRFRTQPAATTVGHTLPPIEVAVLSDGAPVSGDREEAVTIDADPGTLAGTRSQSTRDGVATFGDLSIATPETETRLVATCGAAQAVSDAFTVLEPAPPRLPAGLRVAGRGTRGVQGSLRFLGDDRLAVLRPDRLEVLDAGGELVGAGEITGTPRIVHCWDSLVVVATWEGLVHVGTTAGQVATVDLRASREGFSVPGAVALGADGRLYVGSWNGAVHRLAGGQDWPPDLLLDHPAGVQALGVADSSVYVWGLDGRLCRYDNGRPAAPPRHQPEPVVRHLLVTERSLVGVGNHALFRVHLDGQDPFTEPLAIGEVAGVAGDTRSPVVVDAEGRGHRFDQDLRVWGMFQATAGARPSAADQHGDCCVLVNPDGSHSLVVKERVVRVHPGPLAVSPDGRRVALGDQHGLAIVPLEDAVR
jgi:hypothetical protein